MEKWLVDLLPVMAVEHDCIVSKSGDITVAYEVELPEVFCLSSDDYEALHQVMVKAIKVLPKDSVFFKQDWYLKKKYKPVVDETKESSFLTSSSERFFSERPYLSHTCYIMLTKKPSGRRVSTSILSALLRPSAVPEQTINAHLLSEFLDKAGQFERILSDSGFFRLKRLANDELVSHAGKAGIIEQYCFLSKGEKALLLRDIELGSSIRIGDNHCQLYTLSDVNDLPSMVGSRINYEKFSTDKTKYSVGFASTVGLFLPYNHIYNQYIFIDDPQQTMKKLEGKRLRLQSLAAYSRENAISHGAVNEYLNEAISNQRTPVRASFNLLVWTDNVDELKDIKNSVAGALARMDASAKQESAGCSQIFWAGIPGNSADFPQNDTFSTFIEQATCFFTLESNYRSSTSSFGIRLVDRLSGLPVWTDLSDEPMGKVINNRNKAVFGSSGSGKSMFMNALMHAYYQSGAHCVIVDVGHSYQGLCTLLGGYYFAYSETDPLRFNPFFIAPGDCLDTEKKESIKTLLVALWKREDERFRRSEYVALSNALHLYYQYLDQHKEVFPCFNTFYEYLHDHYVSILQKDNVQDKEFDVTNFLYVLKPYYKGGEYAHLLNATDKLDVFHERFCVFELDAIKDNEILFGVTALVITELFISKMRKHKGVRKVITIEEAWKAIAKSSMAEFMKYLYKTVRKHFGEAIIVSQELDDVISSPVVKDAILNNCDTKILLDMRKFQNKFGVIQAVMGLPDRGVPMALSLNKAKDPSRQYRELMVDQGGIRQKVYGYEPSSEEYYCFTTEEKEKLRVQQYTEKYGSIQKAIEVLVAEERRKIENI
jgi:conjugation system TraG family ATPase